MNLAVRRRRSTLSRLDQEEGFTLIELVVAAMIVLTAVLALAYTATIGFSGIALARQRDGANGIANQMMEQIRGLPFDTIRKGLSSTDLAGDSAIVACGTAKCYTSGTLTETIPISNYTAGTIITPLVPHVRTVTAGPNTYTVKSYITYFGNDSTQTTTYRATVVVTWSNAAVKGASTRVENETVLYAGNGCLSTSTHPFAGPCQPFLYGSAVLSAGEVDVTGSLPDAGFSRGTLWSADISSFMQLEQVNVVGGTTQSSGVSTVPDDGSAEVFSNRNQRSSGADNDPVQNDPDYSTSSLPSLTTKTLSFAGSTGTLSVTARGGDTGTSTSTVTADSSTHLCQSENDNQPCGVSTVFEGQTGFNKTMSATLDLQTSFSDLGPATMAAIDSPSTQSVVFTDRNTASGVTRCVGTSGDGCVHAEGTVNLGQVSLGGLPASLPAGSVPAGWQGYFVRLSNFTETAKAEVGLNAAPPSVTMSGTVSYWNGSGYTTMNLAPGASLSIPVAPLTINTIVDLLPLTVSIRPSANGLKTGSTLLDDPANCGSACTRTSAEALQNSPIKGDILYTVTWGLQTLADLDMHIDLGTLDCQGEYQASPSG